LNVIIGGSRRRVTRNGVRKRTWYGHDWRTGCDADKEGEHHRDRGRINRLTVDESVIVLFCCGVVRGCRSSVFSLLLARLGTQAPGRKPLYNRLCKEKRR
jgi:hypothetical protein